MRFFTLVIFLASIFILKSEDYAQVTSNIHPHSKSLLLSLSGGSNYPFSDYEDSLQYFSALRHECDVIITRNVKDFTESVIPVLTPDEFLNSLK